MRLRRILDDTRLDKTVAPVISEGWVPETRRGCSRFWGWRIIGEEVGDGLRARALRIRQATAEEVHLPLPGCNPHLNRTRVVRCIR